MGCAGRRLGRGEETEVRVWLPQLPSLQVIPQLLPEALAA